MAVARKSDVSARRSWFRRGSVRERTQRGQQLTTGGTGANRAFYEPVSSRRQRRSPNTSDGDKQSFGFYEEENPPPTTPVPDLNKQASEPIWLLRLLTLHRHSSILAFLLVATTLVVYGWTVYSQQVWGQAFRRLQNFQRYERQLTTTNEVLKNKMAQEAQTPAAGLVSPSPNGTIFLRPAPENSNNQETPNTNTDPERPPQTPTPLGY